MSGFRRVCAGWVVVGLIGLLVACDPAPIPPDSSVSDAASPDAGTVDAGTDGGVDASDSGAAFVDEDEDGTPQEVDCDDTDPSTARASVRDCASACATGTETCTDGVWGACSAPVDCACTTPGASRLVACGMCGMASQSCGEDGAWGSPGTCFAEGECAPAIVETESLPMCGSRQRLCDAECHWLPWLTIAPTGECTAGATERVVDDCTGPETRERVCAPDCTWQPPSGACGVSCVGSPSLSRTGADPLCVPAGPFVLGHSEVLSATPVRTITLSEFFVDRYPVTRARYQQCVDAGTCVIPSASAEYAGLRSTQWVRGLTAPQAMVFCEWDGGRLISEFQWEKAARGPAPDTRRHTWGEEDGTDCVHHAGTACNGLPYDVLDTTFPDAVSPYGARLMGVMSEITSTPFLGGWGWLADASSDPADPVPSAPGAFTFRGTSFLTAAGVTQIPRASVSMRAGVASPSFQGFRCVY